MKKFLAMTCLLLVSMMATATAQMKVYAPDFEQDIGYCVTDCEQQHPQMVATLSLDGQAVVTFDIQNNIVDWQTATQTITSAQCVDAYTVRLSDGCTVGVALYALRWPDSKNGNTMATYNDSDNYLLSQPPTADAYSFTAARADYI